MRHSYLIATALIGLVVLAGCGGFAAQPTAASTTSALPTSAPAGVTPTPGDLHALLQQQLDNLPIGQMAFNPPSRMEQGRTDRIELRLTENLNEDITKGLQGSGKPVTETVQIGTFMRARLSGDAFDIKSLNDEEQVVGGSTFTQWAWEVTPLSAGTRTLHLTVSIRVTVGGQQGQKDYPVIDRDVSVAVNPGFMINQFVASYWQWLATVIVIPLLGLAWRIYTSRGKKAA